MGLGEFLILLAVLYQAGLSTFAAMLWVAIKLDRGARK